MGHAIEYFEVDKKSEIMPTAIDFASYSVDRQENPTGSYHGNMHIVDNGRIFNSRSEAERYIENYVRDKWYYDMAVQYREPTEFKPSAKTNALRQKSVELNQKLRDYRDAHSVHLRKSEFIGCPDCGSKLANKRFGGEFCPVCRADLRPKTTIETIQRYEKDIRLNHKAYEDSYEADTVKQAKNGKIRWLVKVEVHC